MLRGSNLRRKEFSHGLVYEPQALTGGSGGPRLTLFQGIGCTITIHWTPNRSVTPPKHCAKNVFPIGIVILPSAASALKIRCASVSVGRLRERDTQSKSVGPERMPSDMNSSAPAIRTHACMMR